jgi:DNA-directed RNA polymerase specialized sigma24 family protein
MRQLMRQVPRKLWQIEQEKAKATKITTVLTGMPRGGSGKNQVEDGAIKLAELKEAFAEVTNELHYMQIELAPLISELENSDDRAVMRLRYIEGYSPEDIAEAIHRTDRSIYYYLSRAENELCRNHPDNVKANG